MGITFWRQCMKRIDLEAGLNLIDEYICPIQDIEKIDIIDALGRVLAEDIYSPIDIPLFDRSPLDGYAIRAEDLGKGDFTRLKVIEKIYAGDVPKYEIEEGLAARIMTGAMIPKGANTILKQELVDVYDEYIETKAQLFPFDNYIPKGEDLKIGDLVTSKNRNLNSILIGLLAGMGIADVEVFRELKIGVLSTGSEVVDYKSNISAGKIYDSNSMTFIQRLKELGFKNIVTGRCGDDVESLKSDFLNLIKNTDFVISTGGVSVGEKDYIPSSLLEIGAKPLFEKVRIKPGSHMVVYKYGDVPILGLSGNPFAALATFEIFGRRILAKLSNVESVFPKKIKSTTINSFDKASRVRRLVRASYENGMVKFSNKHDAGVMSSMISCNCLVDIPEGSEPIAVGEEVELYLL